MPLFGHAFIGLSAGLYTKPRSVNSFGVGMWIPIIIFLNYLPDIVAQISLLLGMHGLEIAAHSLISGILISLIISPGLMVLSHLSFYRAIFISLFSIWTHDLLDLWQTPQRLLLWPVSTYRLSSEYTSNGLSPINEIIIFGFIFMVSIIIYLTFFYDNNSKLRYVKSMQQQHVSWIASTSIVIIFIIAGSTYYLRTIRAEEFKEAKNILETTKNYTLAITLIEKAARWPYCGNFEWISYFKARAYWGLGDRKQAALYYQKSLGFL